LAICDLAPDPGPIQSGRMIRVLAVESAKTYFDTNVSDHHHFLVAETGELVDIPAHDIALGRLPEPPPGTAIERVDVIVRLGKRN